MIKRLLKWWRGDLLCQLIEIASEMSDQELLEAEQYIQAYRQYREDAR
jgi:hypothetical protein